MQINCKRISAAKAAIIPTSTWNQCTGIAAIYQDVISHNQASTCSSMRNISKKTEIIKSYKYTRMHTNDVFPLEESLISFPFIECREAVFELD